MQLYAEIKKGLMIEVRDRIWRYVAAGPLLVRRQHAVASDLEDMITFMLSGETRTGIDL